ncbi:MAG: hypothetical protein ACP5KB_03500 [Thermoprotei archaeon]
MRKLLVMGASGKLLRHIVLSLIRDYELFLQCSKRCEELKGFLTQAVGELSGLSIHLIKHNFLEEGVEVFAEKLRALTSKLDASILIEPLFNQSSFQDLREEQIRSIVYLNLIVPMTLLRVLASFMGSEQSVIIVLTDLTPLKGSRVYAGLNPSLPTVASSAALHAVIREAPNYLPANIRVFGVALDWVNVPSKKLPLNAVSVAMSIDYVTSTIKELLEDPLKLSSGTLIELSLREKTV